LSLVSRWHLLYTSCVHGAPYAFNDILINYQKMIFKKAEVPDEFEWPKGI
jgi:hypothetical protein